MRASRSPFLVTRNDGAPFPQLVLSSDDVSREGCVADYGVGFKFSCSNGNATNTPGSQNFDPPNYGCNFSDIGQMISGFGGFPYKGYDPDDCPDEPNWP